MKPGNIILWAQAQKWTGGSLRGQGSESRQRSLKSQGSGSKQKSGVFLLWMAQYAAAIDCVTLMVYDDLR